MKDTLARRQSEYETEVSRLTLELEQRDSVLEGHLVAKSKELERVFAENTAL